MSKSTLSQWFFKNTKLPLLLIGTAVALVQVGFIFYIHNKTKDDQKSAIESLVATIANIGIEQRNRPLLESSFQLAIDELGVKSMLVCEGQRKVFFQPMGFGSCPVPPQASPFESVISITPSGFKNYRLYFYVKRFQVGPSLIWLNIIILGLLGIVFHLIFRIQRKLAEDVLNPLEDNLSGDEELKIKELNTIKLKFEEYRQSKEKQAVAGAIVEHNLSIGHNIKSIRQTLDVIMSGEFTCDRQKRRIEDLSKNIKAIMVKIADQIPDTDKVKLITSDETFFDYLQKENEKKTKVNVVNVFEIAVEQKNVELQKSKNKPKIKLRYNNKLKNKFLEVVGPELRDILSNMMNNSIEAGASKIDIQLSRQENDLKVTIKDNGSGIPEKIKSQIFDRGFTNGKEGGTGYGLYHAHKFIESWGGSFTLSNEANGATEFEIRLPLWTLPNLGIEAAETVVVLDDDEKVHDSWKSKLSRINPAASLLSFTSQRQLSEWFDTCDDFSGHLFFFDSDLGADSSDSGEALIESFGIGNMAHLVTNNYNSPILTKWCAERGISVLPKMTV